MDRPGQSSTTMDEKKPAAARPPIRVLLLDDHIDNLFLRSAILRKHGYEAVTASSIEEAEARLHEVDLALLEYHLGAGKFGTEVATTLRENRTPVPIIILSATLARWFGAVEHLHLLTGYS